MFQVTKSLWTMPMHSSSRIPQAIAAKIHFLIDWQWICIFTTSIGILTSTDIFASILIFVILSSSNNRNLINSLWSCFQHQVSLNGFLFSFYAILVGQKYCPDNKKASSDSTSDPKNFVMWALSHYDLQPRVQHLHSLFRIIYLAKV